LDTREAMQRAREAEMDLVEVSPNSRPPVCRIMDYGKWKYAQKKKERKARSHRHETELKEIRIKTPKISKHDLDIKIKNAREFLLRGDRVQFTLRFRGRELAHIDLGQGILTAVKTALADVAKLDRDFRMENRRLSLVLTPVAGVKKPEPKPSAAGAGAPSQGPELSEAEKLAQPGRLEEILPELAEVDDDEDEDKAEQDNAEPAGENATPTA
jgi:translation initiation factor IF-3